MGTPLACHSCFELVHAREQFPQPVRDAEVHRVHCTDFRQAQLCSRCPYRKTPSDFSEVCFPLCVTMSNACFPAFVGLPVTEEQLNFVDSVTTQPR